MILHQTRRAINDTNFKEQRLPSEGNSRLVASKVKTCPAFVKLQGSLVRAQQHATERYSEPDESSQTSMLYI
jgi:hypothetical protein